MLAVFEVVLVLVPLGCSEAGAGGSLGVAGAVGFGAWDEEWEEREEAHRGSPRTICTEAAARQAERR